MADALSLENVRRRKGLSLQGLARIAGLDPAIVFSLEHGRGAPTEPTITSIASALGLSPGEVVRAFQAARDAPSNPKRPQESEPRARFLPPSISIHDPPSPRFLVVGEGGRATSFPGLVGSGGGSGLPPDPATFAMGSPNALHEPVPPSPPYVPPDAFEEAANEAASNPDPAIEREIFESAFNEEPGEGADSATFVGRDAPAVPPPVRKRTRKAASTATTIKIRNRSQVIQYSKILIAALEEVVDYDPARHHNQPPPDLRIDNEDYLTEIRNLVAELRKLNALLETTRRQPKKASEAVVNLTRHFDTFLNSYAKSVAKGAGWLTIATIGALLYQAGIGQDVIAHILSHAKLPH